MVHRSSPREPPATKEIRAAPVRPSDDYIHSSPASRSFTSLGVEPRFTVSRQGRVGEGRATCSAAALPRTPSIVLPISLAIVANGCLPAIRWRSSASAPSVQRHRFLIVTATLRVHGPRSSAGLFCVHVRAGITQDIEAAFHCDSRDSNADDEIRPVLTRP